MKLSHLSPFLHRSALVIAVAGFALWVGAGARVGWTQTSIVSLQRDEITGIDYPVRQPAFRPGVEIPLLAAVAAAGLVSLAWLAGRRPDAKA